METEIRIDTSAVDALLGELAGRLSDARPVMQGIGEIILASVQRNFEVEGRPGWKRLRPATIKERTRKKKWPGKILSRSGSYGLLGSINYRAGSDSVSIGTNKIYAAVHQFGAKRGEFGTVTAHIKAHYRRRGRGKKRTPVKAHTRTMVTPWGDIPARPYLMVQDEDWEEIRGLLESYLARGER